VQRVTLALIAASLGLSAGCADLRGMMSLQRDLAREFGTSAISINLSQGNLTVAFVNSPAGQLPDSGKAAFARRVAECVRDHYVGYRDLALVRVGFTRSTTVGPLSTSSTEVPYTFTPSELGAPTSSPRDANAGRPSN